MTIRLYVLLLISLVSVLDLHGQKSIHQDAIALMEVWLESQKDFDQLPGISVAFVEDQTVVWSGAFGYANPEKSLSSTDTTICSICSISKLFTAVAIMKLYDDGKLRLDDRVSDILPHFDLPQQYQESGPITVRGLLTHSSGLPRESAHPYWTGPDFPFPSQQDIIAGLESQQTLYPASTYFQYSNLGLTLLGQIVEELSGMTYDEYISQEIFDPLGLANTRSYMPEDLHGSQLAVGYSATTRSGKREPVEFFQANGIAPAAGFSSTVLDLSEFAKWNFRLRDTSKTEILQPATLKMMQQVHWTDPDWNITWGLGFSVYKGKNGHTWASHGGSCPGYRSTIQLDLHNKKAYIAMINASGTNPGKYTGGIQAILEKVGTIAEPDSSFSHDLQQYIGYYSTLPWWAEEYIGVWGDQLVQISLPTGSPGESMTMFKHVEGDTFRRVRDNGELGEELIFFRNDQGEIEKYSQHGNFSTIINR